MTLFQMRRRLNSARHGGWLCKLLSQVALSGTLILLAAVTRAADVDAARQIAARTELHLIQTLTLTDRDFLLGDASRGAPVVISGELRIAQGTGRLPLVILQHGSSGIAANIDVWSRELNAIGISSFVLDGFTGRGLTEVNTNQAALGRLNLILDIYRALDVLANNPRVDPNRIALMGFSRGGQATLYASLKRFHRMWNRSGIEFTAYIPFYPDCMTTYLQDTDTADRPIRIFGGAADDYNPLAVCKAYVQRLKNADHDVDVTEYPGAAHAFDNPLGAHPPIVQSKFETVRNCQIREQSDGSLINVATGQPFTYKDVCVEHGPHLGYDPAANEEARSSVKKFLTTIFKNNQIAPDTSMSAK